MLQNARVTAFTISMLLRKNQQEGGGKIIFPPYSHQVKDTHRVNHPKIKLQR